MYTESDLSYTGLVPKWPQQLGCFRPRLKFWNKIQVSHTYVSEPSVQASTCCLRKLESATEPELEICCYDAEWRHLACCDTYFWSPLSSSFMAECIKKFEKQFNWNLIMYQQQPPKKWPMIVLFIHLISIFELLSLICGARDNWVDL